MPQPGTGSPPAPDALGDYLASHGKTPEDYVIDKFRDHDIVFIGEEHEIADNLELLQGLIPRLYAAGIYNLGFEFSNHKEQAKIDRLLTAPIYDERVVRDLLIDWNGIEWGFKEYADVYRAAWRLNHSLPPKARKFRIVAVDILRRITIPSLIRPGERVGDPQVRNRMLGGQFRDMINIYWANVITKEFIQKEEKALIYCGSGHSYTKFFRQRETDNGLSAGNLIYNNIGTKVFRIGLHGSQDPVVATMDRLMSAVPASARRVGFDIQGSPIASIPATGVEGYLYGHSKRCSDFTLGDILDGYLFLAPIADLKPVTLLQPFVTPDVLPRIQTRLQVQYERKTLFTLEEIERIRRERLERYFSRFQKEVLAPQR